MKSEVVFGLDDAAWPALLTDAQGGVLLSNTAARDIFGPALADPSGLAAAWSPANELPPAEYLAKWEMTKPVPVELPFRVAGRDRQFLVSIAQLANENGKWYVLQMFPPPVRKAAELPPECHGATGDAALKQRLECVLQLARTVSLDFNNALTGVLAHTSLLLGKAEPEHPWRRSLLAVEKAAARAAEIATELALFSRQEKETRRTSAGNLNTVTSRCLEAFRSTTGARLTWRLNLERSLCEARCDEAKVQQALTKIFENAVESFGPRDSGLITVATRNVELTEATQDRNVRLAAGRYVCVEIIDDGAGIDDPSLARVFEPFFTTKPPPHRGLGLALVYGIITNHGGGVAISSQVGKGTSTRMYLPAEKTVVMDTLATDKELHGTATILMVDDEAILLTMGDTILTDYGYRVLTANHGQKALQILDQPENQIDLVIIDLVMPGMGGRELMGRIRKRGFTMPLMATSGYLLPEDKQAQSAYLQKPFTSLDLLRKVKAALADGTVID